MEVGSEQLNKIGLFALRKIAREIGVKSPTSLVKKDLIDEILKIKNGEKEPFKTKIGRPVINTDNEEVLLDLLSIKVEKHIKKEVINTILKEVEKKLNELLQV